MSAVDTTDRAVSRDVIAERWLPTLRTVAGVIVVAAVLGQLVFAEAFIPPLDVIALAFVAGWIVSVRRPRAGAITMGAASLAYLIGAGPFDGAQLAHPDSFLPFIVATATTAAGIVGLVGFIAVLTGRPLGNGRTAMLIG